MSEPMKPEQGETDEEWAERMGKSLAERDGTDAVYKPAQAPENFMYLDIECQRKGCQALVIEAQAKRVERLERRIAQWEGDGIEKDAAIGALQQALRDAYEQCALACIDMPQQGGSTYTYWPCVNAIRALGHAHAQTAATPATGAP